MAYFPNISFFLIPTNWAHTNTKDLVEMIKAMDQNTAPKKERMVFHLQLSIDGPPGDFNKQGHPGDWALYKKNIASFCADLKNVTLNNIQIVFEVHPTASKEVVFKNFNDSAGLNDYITKMQDFIVFINQEIDKNNLKDKLISAKQVIAPLVALPSKMTVEEGTKFEALARLSEYSQYVTVPDLKFGEHVYHQFSHAMNSTSVLNENCQCTESSLAALMINPDGTITECACSYIQNSEDYLNEVRGQGRDFEYRTALMRTKYFCNPITASKKELEEFDWYTLHGLRGTESVQLSLAFSLAQEMALSRQIDYNYYLNPMALLNQLSGCGMMYSCTREHINDTRIPYMCSLTDLRKNFNGFTQYVNESRINEGRYKIENVVRDAPFIE